MAEVQDLRSSRILSFIVIGLRSAFLRRKHHFAANLDYAGISMVSDSAIFRLILGAFERT